MNNLRDVQYSFPFIETIFFFFFSLTEFRLGPHKIYLMEEDQSSFVMECMASLHGEEEKNSLLLKQLARESLLSYSFHHKWTFVSSVTILP